MTISAKHIILYDNAKTDRIVTPSTNKHASERAEPMALHQNFLLQRIFLIAISYFNYRTYGISPPSIVPNKVMRCPSPPIGFSIRIQKYLRSSLS